MVEVRKSTRIKAEAGAKRRFSDALEAEATPAKPAKAAKTTAKATPKTATKKSPAVQEPARVVLPTKLTDSTPLPVLPTPQPDDLDDAEWQDLGSSGVFAASLTRARQAIVKGAYFTKFWTKPQPTKKLKDMTEEEKAEFRALKGPTQSKVGSVKMISEPFTIEVNLLMIKDQQGGHKQGQLPLDKQHLIYGTPPAAQRNSYAPAYRQPLQQTPVHHHHHQHQTQHVPPPPARPHPPIAQAGNTPSMQVAPSRPNIVNTTANHSHTQPQTAVHPHQPSPAIKTETKPAPSPAPPSTPKPASSSQAPDPVIHALAQRARDNAELKAVMKIVATGRASPQQLQYFQKHIDELTELVRRRQEQSEVKPEPTSQTPAVKTEVQTPAPVGGAASANTTVTQPPARPPSTPAVGASQPQTPVPTTQAAPTPIPASQAPPTRPPITTPNTTATATLPPAQRPPPQPSHQQAITQPTPQQHYRPPPPIQQAPTTPHPHHPHQQPVWHPPPIQQVYTPPQPQPPKIKTVVTATPLHILLQFAENPNERFLFPKNCVLDWNSNLTEVVCSFVAVKSVPDGKGEDGKEKMKEVWLPVTVRFQGDAATLSVLGRVAEPLDRARWEMEGVMVGERGEDGWLALRLPAEGRSVEV